MTPGGDVAAELSREGAEDLAQVGDRGGVEVPGVQHGPDQALSGI
ncbi:MAG TPA: hypothetical protein VGP44_07235 [Gemmatimonadales bacterium]|nr:hypothetical protein [Gemmatimonadales bacterium]